jgi:beta-glucosidase
MWGAATSAFQIEGTQTANNKQCNNSWTRHADCKGGRCAVNPKIKHKKIEQPGIACNHWNLYKEDVALIKQAGLNSYRFSIEWSKINPQKDIFYADAMQHYIDLVDELIENKIQPIVCLFHHAWPTWFDDMGGFEKKENIKEFVAFARYVFEKLHKKVDIWMTFNEPVGYAMEGYFRGHYPPFKKDIRICGEVVANMLNAHVAVYHLFHELDTRASLKIGFPKVFNPLDPYYTWQKFDVMICNLFNRLLHDSALNFFKDGRFVWNYVYGQVKSVNSDAKGALDFLGVNYYTHTTICNFSSIINPIDTRAGSRGIYPEGLYRSIKKAHELTSVLRIPMHIAENGVNDPNDLHKDEFFKQHLYIVQKAMAEGIDIDGYFVWSLMDSFSWKSGQDSKMGLYKVDPTTFTRTLYPNAQPFVNFLKKQK